LKGRDIRSMVLTPNHRIIYIPEGPLLLKFMKLTVYSRSANVGYLFYLQLSPVSILPLVGGAYGRTVVWAPLIR